MIIINDPCFGPPDGVDQMGFVFACVRSAPDGVCQLIQVLA